MSRIAIFASGNGTNAQRIIEYFQERGNASVGVVLSNKRSAKVLERADKLNVSAVAFNRASLYDQDHILHLLQGYNPDLIVLAGFLWLFPEKILKAFPNKVINIHPALLPKYGGKGMYGMNVHKSVIANSEKESGITIHYVSKEYDKGNIIFQAKTSVSSNDSPENLAQKIHELEYEHFPQVIEQLLSTSKNG